MGTAAVLLFPTQRQLAEAQRACTDSPSASHPRSPWAEGGRLDPASWITEQTPHWHCGAVHPPRGEWQAVGGGLQGYQPGMGCVLRSFPWSPGC